MMDWRSNKVLALAAAGLLLAGLGGGFLIAKATDGSAHRATVDSRGNPIPHQGWFANWNGFGRPRGANAPRAGVPKPAGFAVWRQRIDTSGPNPKACVEFTRPLDASKPYADFVLVSPDPGVAPATTVRGSELCITGLGFYDRRVTLLKGLPARGGEVLRANADVDFVFGEKPPYVGFAGDGVILPRQDSDGVGIETVNVQRLSIEVWRVPDRNLVRKSISAPDPTGEDEYAGDWGEDSVGDDGRRVWQGTIPVRGQAGQRTTTVFPLGSVLKEMRPGAYVIKARDASGGRDLVQDDDDYDSAQPAQARRWILFTDMALVSYTGADGLDVTVRSLKTAKPMSGVRVVLVARDGDDLATAVSDGQGHVRFAKSLLDGEGPADARMVMAYGPGADFTTMDIERTPVDLSNQGIGGRQTGGDAVTAGRAAAGLIDSYLYTDRGVYRPGETVRLVALLRDNEARAVTNRSGFLIVKRPSGVEAFRFRFDKPQFGYAAANIALPRSAPRGRWTAIVQADGVEEPVGKVTFGVEDFAPQRLAVEIARSVGAAPIRALDESRPVPVDARFLYGAPGAGLQVQGEARVKIDYDPFPAFEGFRWGDEQSPFEEKLVQVAETVTDGAGHATLAFNGADVGDTAQPLKALFNASVFEPGGRPVTESTELKIRRRPLFLGVKVDPGSDSRRDPTVGFDIIAVDPEGRRIGASNVNWTIITENWDYDWFQQDGRWQWRRTSRDQVAARGTLNVGAGSPAKLARRLGWGDYRLVLEEPTTGAKTVIRFAAGWGAPAKDAEAPDFVRVSAGSATYGQGDTISITIKGPYAGEAQVAVATDRILELRNITVPAGGTTIRLKSNPSWGGGAYVMVSLVQPRNPVSTPKPRRAVGLAYVPLDPGKRKLKVDIGTPDQVRGREQLVVPIKVVGLPFGKRARVTVAAVDQGILNLTRFDSPDPAKWYFGKRALGVDYRDDYGRLLDPNLGAPAALNYGADEIGGEGLTVTPIKSVALWSGVVETGLDGTARITLPAPDFNGEMRLMAVAWTEDAVGAQSEKLVVREPVVADLALPRFLAPGDQAFATLELHNLEGKPGGYTAVVAGENGVAMTFRKIYQLIVGQRVAERLPIAAPVRAGVGGVKFTLNGPSFSQTRSYGLETRSGWGPQTRVTSELQSPNTVWTPPSALLAGFQPGSATLHVSYSPFRGFDPAPIAAALSRYPYGCTEQLVSAAYPWLYVSNATVANQRSVRRASPLLTEAVGKLLDRQAADGSFGLWRVGDGEADPWLGAYATDFLIEARAHGAPVPQQALDKALAAMRLVSRPDGWASVGYRMEYPEWWGGDRDRSKAMTERMRSQASAYALYVLAKGGKGDLARLRWWHDVQFRTEKSPLARAQIGAALAMMGDRSRARSAFRQAIETLGYREQDNWYQSPLRDLSGVIALAYEAGETATARALQKRLEDAVADPDALNTQEQARLLQAAHWMLRQAGTIRVDATGATLLTDSGGARRWGVGRLADARFTNRGTGALWRTVTVRGAPLAEPGSASNGLTVQKSFFTMSGGIVNPATLTQGDRIVIRVAGRSNQGRTLPLVIDDALPAGYEIETVLGPEDAKDGPFKFLGELTQTDVQEMRDDRYVAAFDLGGGQPYAVAYVARAVTPGSFYLPGSEARDMYRPNVFARTTGARTTVLPGS